MDEAKLAADVMHVTPLMHITLYGIWYNMFYIGICKLSYTASLISLYYRTYRQLVCLWTSFLNLITLEWDLYLYLDIYYTLWINGKINSWIHGEMYFFVKLSLALSLSLSLSILGHTVWLLTMKFGNKTLDPIANLDTKCSLLREPLHTRYSELTKRGSLLSV